VNGHISGRSLGGPTSELNMRRLLGQEQLPDALVNYTSRNDRGQLLKSSSLAIRDSNGKMIGAFCLHLDISQFEQFQKFLEFFISSHNLSRLGINEFSNSQTQDDEFKQEIDQWMLQQGLFTAKLTYKHKQAIVEHLYQQGSFKKKGAISSIAANLQLTRQSIYNYLELAKRNTHGKPCQTSVYGKARSLSLPGHRDPSGGK
jgi:predicted transcriptional regulator YheO